VNSIVCQDGGSESIGKREVRLPVL
jgi:hypothetical protein